MKRIANDDILEVELETVGELREILGRFPLTNDDRVCVLDDGIQITSAEGEELAFVHLP